VESKPSENGSASIDTMPGTWQEWKLDAGNRRQWRDESEASEKGDVRRPKLEKHEAVSLPHLVPTLL